MDNRMDCCNRSNCVRNSCERNNCEKNICNRCHSDKSNKKELWNIIVQTSFALDDIKLFLDTHLCDKEALEAYEEYRKVRNVAVMEYTKEYGPISAYNVETCNKWEWINSPWPWEGEC